MKIGLGRVIFGRWEAKDKFKVDGVFRWRLPFQSENMSTVHHHSNKDISHIGIRSGRVRRTDTGIDKPVVAVLESRNIHIEDLFDMIRKVNFFDFNARIL